MSRTITVVLCTVAAIGLLACDENPTGTDSTPLSEGARQDVEASVASPDATGANLQTAAALTGTIPLPIKQTVTSLETAFSITQKGEAQVGYFKLDNPAATSIALRGESNGFGYAVQGIAFGKAIGGYFGAHNYASGADALQGYTSGTGNAVHGIASSAGRAGFFENTLYNNSNSALAARTMGTGWAGVFLAPQGGKGIFVQTNSSTTSLDATNIGTGFAAKFYGKGSAKGVYIETQGGAGLQVVGGSKNAVVRTPSGAKALYTEESTEVWFTDYGFGNLIKGTGRILFDPSFAQTINPDESYHVFVQPYGRAELYVAERTPLGFTVALKDGDPNVEFSYRIVAKRLGFEGKRLEPAPWADQLSTGN
jgi:hypothetical protein